MDKYKATKLANFVTIPPEQKKGTRAKSQKARRSSLETKQLTGHECSNPQKTKYADKGKVK